MNRVKSFPDLLQFGGLADPPHLQGVQGKVLVPRQLGTAVGGACGPRPAMATPKVTVQPQAEVAVLTAHTLLQTGGPNHRETQRGQGHVFSRITLLYCMTNYDQDSTAATRVP